ncbi:MAG: hypothetical protein H5U08_00695 [Thermogutta sp.]|uniref:hypothetical protein n=1 Tax=Thermogutta sp. TaxID=1962930 RepID=UPI0019B969FE|nr:hypothetical protein [Thermogutta sp.]MBC7350853.1 hypothetical protein [Thermogutta sp.]
MDGLARVAGILERTIHVGGKDLTLSTPTLGAWAALESQLVQETNDVLEKAVAVAAKLPPDQRAVFWEQAHRVASQRCAITLDDIARLPPFEQVVMQWFVCLQRHHAAEFPTLQSVRELLLREFGDVPIDELQHQIAQIVEGGLKNSTGPTEERHPA